MLRATAISLPGVFLLALLLPLTTMPGVLHADEDDPATDGGMQQPEDDGEEAGEDDPRAVVPELRVLDDAEARPLVDALNKAARRRDTPDIQPALEALDGVRHEDFLKPLIKLLGNENGRMAQMAGDLLEFRATADVAKDLWKRGWDHKANRRRYAVRTSVLRAYGRLGLDLDKRQFDDVVREWRWMLGNPHESFGPALADICWYVGVRGDKRHALAIAHELDAPESTDANNPATPPVEWWERRWKQWQVMQPEAVRALERLTGTRLATREEAKAWFLAHVDTFGVTWRDV